MVAPDAVVVRWCALVRWCVWWCAVVRGGGGGGGGVWRRQILQLLDVKRRHDGSFALLAVCGILYGALVALVQQDFKFVIGFSSVSHMGVGATLTTLSKASNR